MKSAKNVGSIIELNLVTESCIRPYTSDFRPYALWNARAAGHDAEQVVDALARLRELIELAAHVPEIRRPTRPTRNSQKRRVDTKVRRGQVKLQRGRVKDA